ncbi:MAG: response regulator [Rubrivivax sp.]|nr:response regulator [Rubrivivax sp.]
MTPSADDPLDPGWRGSRERGAAALRACERRYAALVAVAGEGVWSIDEQALTTFANPRMAEMLGTTPEAMLGRPLTDHMDAEAVQALGEYMQRPRTGVSEAHEFRFRRADGSPLWAWITSQALMDDDGRFVGALAMVTDVCERKRQAARDASRERVMTLLSAGAPLGHVLEAIVRGVEEEAPEVICSVMLVDPLAHCLRMGAAPSLPAFFNEAAEGLPIGPGIASCGEAAFSGQRTVARDIETDPRWAPYRELARRAGVAACWSQPVLSRAGAVLGTFGVYHRRIHEPTPAEVTTIADVAKVAAIAIERKQADDALRQTQKLESLGTLAGGVAHDFNNVLGAILANLALARDSGPLAPAQTQALDQVQRSALRARLLVQQILAFSHRQPTPAQRQPLAPLVRDALDLLRSTLPASVQLRARLDEGLPDVEADGTQVQQVLLNLCTNAWHALQGAPGVIEIGATVAADHEAPAGLPDGPLAHLWVRDSGIGMDEATRARIFEPFFTTKPVGSGTGLGLAVVHGIVTEHRGAITVDTAPGQGATFHVWLPAARSDAPPAPLPLPTERLLAEGAGRHLLFVDDDEVMRITVENLLSRQGFSVSTAASTREALALLRDGQRHFELVISDHNMPDSSGLDLARELRAWRPGLPLVICSGYVDADLHARAETAGVRAIVRKEYLMEELPGIVQRVLQGGA